MQRGSIEVSSSRLSPLNPRSCRLSIETFAHTRQEDAGSGFSLGIQVARIPGFG
jgi:hypothetical protein